MPSIADKYKPIRYNFLKNLYPVAYAFSVLGSGSIYISTVTSDSFSSTGLAVVGSLGLTFSASIASLASFKKIRNAIRAKELIKNEEQIKRFLEGELGSSKYYTELIYKNMMSGCFKSSMEAELVAKYIKLAVDYNIDYDLFNKRIDEMLSRVVSDGTIKKIDNATKILDGILELKNTSSAADIANENNKKIIDKIGSIKKDILLREVRRGIFNRETKHLFQIFIDNYNNSPNSNQTKTLERIINFINEGTIPKIKEFLKENSLNKSKKESKDRVTSTKIKNVQYSKVNNEEELGMNQQVIP